MQTNDNEFLHAKIRSLENECRALRQGLRDQFAMAALTGLLAKHGDAGWHPEGEVQSIQGAADTAFEYADAMMEARQ